MRTAIFFQDVDKVLLEVKNVIILLPKVGHVQVFGPEVHHEAVIFTCARRTFAQEGRILNSRAQSTSFHQWELLTSLNIDETVEFLSTAYDER